MNKLSKLEKSWILYDIGNSAYVLLASTILPIVFAGVAERFLDSVTYLAHWGYAISYIHLDYSHYRPNPRPLIRQER